MADCFPESDSITPPTVFGLGHAEFLSRLGANKMAVPFEAVDGTKNRPGLAFQGNQKTGFFLGSNGGIWVTLNGREVFQLVASDSGEWEVLEQPAETPNGALTDFTVDHDIDPGTASVYINGLEQQPSTHFTTSGQTVSFTFAPWTGAKILVTYRRAAA